MPGALYPDTVRLAGAKLVERIGLLNTDRLACEAANDGRSAVRDSVLIHDLIDAATVPELQAALIHATTPELMSVPVVLGPAPAVEPQVPLYVAVRTPVWELYCVDSGRAVHHEGDRCLSHGAADRMCTTHRRRPRCKHPRISANHPTPTCEECGERLRRLDPAELEQAYRDSPGFRERGL